MEVDVFGFRGISTDDIVNPNSTFIIAGYWWGRGNINRNSREGKTYDQLADRLVYKCIELGINYCMVEIPEFAVKGGYQKAINFKPVFIKYMMLRYPDLLICTLDTDMIPVKYPYLLDNPDYDYMSFNWNNEVRTIDGVIPCYTPYVLKTSGGLICMRHSPTTIALVDEWADYSIRYPGKAEDRTITAVFESKKYIEKLRCLWLPMEYLWVPYFYEIELDFRVAKNEIKNFRGKVDKSGYSIKDYTVQKFFGVRDTDLVVVHPEALTEEETASLQGADPDRVPYDWYYYSGLKRRCLTKNSKLVNNPTMYCTSRQQINQLKPLNKWKDKLGFAKYTIQKLKMKNTKTTGISYTTYIGNSPYMVVSICDDDIKAREFGDRLASYDMSYVIYIGKNLEKNKAFLIYSTMVDADMDILYLDSSCRFGRKNITIDTYSDFACINASATPVFKSRYVDKPCNDSRILQCFTTDILFFKNSFFAKNLLCTWDNEIKRGVQTRIALSIAFNKYSFIIPMRVKWFDPSMFAYTAPVYIDSYYPGAWTFISDKEIIPWNKTTNIYTYLEQCGTKPPLEDDNGDDRTYFSSSKYIQ